MKILVLTGDAWHPSNISRSSFEKLDDSGFQFEWKECIDEELAERIFDYSLVIIAKANHVSETDKQPWLTEKTEKVLEDYVHKGNGLLVVHSGLAEYDQNKTLRGLMGGVFVEHPDQCPVTYVPKENHPLTEGSAPYNLIDEHYFVELDDDDIDVFVVSESEYGSQPGSWTRTQGDGRVCVLTQSHNEEGLVHPSFQALLLNSLNWCAAAA